MSIAPTFEQLVEVTRHCTAVGVDIPIGLSENEYWRQADLEARRVLGPRATSVFPAPVRATLAATSLQDRRESYTKARELSFWACGKKMTPFAHGILKKVKEANEAMTSEHQKRIVEVHPEVSFWALNDQRRLQHSKKSPAGALTRLELVSRELDYELEQTGVEGRATFDDFLDACVAAWTASRVAHHIEKRLPATPAAPDSHGLRMEIVY